MKLNNSKNVCAYWWTDNSIELVVGSMSYKKTDVDSHNWYSETRLITTGAKFKILEAYLAVALAQVPNPRHW